MSAQDRLAETTAALVHQTRVLVGFGIAWDQIGARFNAALASVKASHAAGIATDDLGELEKLKAGLNNIEALVLGALAKIDGLLEQAGGDGVG